MIVKVASMVVFTEFLFFCYESRPLPHRYNTGTKKIVLLGLNFSVWKKMNVLGKATHIFWELIYEFNWYVRIIEFEFL